MNTLTRQIRQTPPPDCLADLLTDSTRLAILQQLATPQYYESLLGRLTPMTRQTLSLTLQQLTRTQLVTSTIDMATPTTKVRYQLTPLAQELLPLLTDFQSWQQRYLAAQQSH